MGAIFIGMMEIIKKSRKILLQISVLIFVSALNFGYPDIDSQYSKIIEERLIKKGFVQIKFTKNHFNCLETKNYPGIYYKPSESIINKAKLYKKVIPGDLQREATSQYTFILPSLKDFGGLKSFSTSIISEIVFLSASFYNVISEIEHPDWQYLDFLVNTIFVNKKNDTVELCMYPELSYQGAYVFRIFKIHNFYYNGDPIETKPLTKQGKLVIKNFFENSYGAPANRKW